MTALTNEQVLALGFLAIYFVVAEILRTYMIGGPLRTRLRERYEEAIGEARRVGLPSTDQTVVDLEKAQRASAPVGMWNGAFELAGWRRIHRTEEVLVGRLPDAEVFSRLVQERTRVATLPAAEAASWTIVLGRHIDPRGAPRHGNHDVARADLAALLNARHQVVDSRFEAYVDLNRKAVLLGITGLLLIGGLVITLPANIPFLLAGAVGGFLSRLRRVVVTSDAPTDYGASWVPLLLAPLVGALTGFAGIAFVTLALKLGVLTFPAVIVSPTELSGLALALLFGFAERLIDGLTETLVGQIATPAVSAEQTILSTTLASEQEVPAPVPAVQPTEPKPEERIPAAPISETATAQPQPAKPAGTTLVIPAAVPVAAVAPGGNGGAPTGDEEADGG